jgi:HAMP domain-containing protein
VAAAVVMRARRPRAADAVAWLGLVVAGIAMVGLLELVGDSEPLFGRADVPPVAIQSVALLFVSAVAIEFLVGDRAGAVWALWGEGSLRSSMLRRFVLPIPVIVAGPLAAVVIALENDNGNQDDARLAAQVGVGMVVALLVAASVVGNEVAQRIARSLGTMRDSASKIAAGDLSTPVISEGSDEIAELTRHVEAMRRSLQRGSHYDAVVRDASRAVSRAHDLAAAFAAFGRVIEAEVPFDRASLAVAEPASGEHVIVAVFGPKGWRIPVGVTLPVLGDVGRQVRAGETVYEEDVGARGDNEPYDVLLARGVRSFVVVPVMVAADTRMLFSFACEHADGFTEIGRAHV